MSNTPIDQSCRWEVNSVRRLDFTVLHAINHMQLVGWRNTLVLVPYGNRFREYRRYFHQLIGSRHSMEVFHPTEELETHIFLQKVLAKPADLAAHIRRYVSCIYSINTSQAKLPAGRLVQLFFEYHMVMNCRETTIRLWTWQIKPRSNFLYLQPPVLSSSM